METLEGEELDLNWVCCLLEDIPSNSDSLALHSPNPLTSSASRSAGTTLDSSEGPDGTEESCRKRFRVGSNVTSSLKACREKQRRDQVNKRFFELSGILELGTTPKLDKTAILTDAIRRVKLLRQEFSSLTSKNEGLRQTINEIKAEKNELRTEKRKLKSEKDEMENRLKALGSNYSVQIPYTIPPQAFGSKLIPLVNCQSVPLWQFVPQASIDTSHDHVLHPPVA